MKKVKYAIIGCGGIANGKHMPAIKKLPDVEMVAFCDLIVDRAEKANTDYGAGKGQVYTDYKELLKKADVDAVAVCTPQQQPLRNYRCRAERRQARHLRKADGNELCRGLTDDRGARQVG